MMTTDIPDPDADMPLLIQTLSTAFGEDNTVGRVHDHRKITRFSNVDVQLQPIVVHVARSNRQVGLESRQDKEQYRVKSKV
jgi:hypothetical protein